MTHEIKNDKAKQFGRSMVETLGVLSIVGVLSIGATVAIQQGLITQYYIRCESGIYFVSHKCNM